MSNKKKAVFLFGAGAVLDWGAPRTLCERSSYTVIPEHRTGEMSNRPCCLTHLILNIGFKTIGGERITQKIYNRLKEINPNAYINFETLINVVEDLYAYWAAKSGKEINNIYSIIELDDALAQLHDFSVIRNDQAQYYSLSVPGWQYLGADHVSFDIDPHVKYYELLINELLSGIVGHVSKYSYGTENHKVVDDAVNSELNIGFCAWMQSFADKDFTIRMYTLNYDDIFRQLLQSKGKSVLDGYFPSAESKQFDIPTDLKSIVLDGENHCHYNLHGSWFWRVKALNENGIAGYRYLKSIHGVINSSVASKEIEKGNAILLTNIISGYQKVQKTAISPFRQLFSSLDRDCLVADELFIVGYSFGDEHVNDIIRNARRHNVNLRITIIDPSFDHRKFSIDFITNWGALRTFIYDNVTDGEATSATYNVSGIKLTFAQFLKDLNDPCNIDDNITQ
jgi:hypothetical protein